MAQGADRSRSTQFVHDLKEIRLANGVSIADIHRESKIPVGLIESFEESGLFDHTMFNRVYLRSFVRTYAEAIGVPPDVALASLEDALDGVYRRALAVAYLDLDPVEIDDASGEDLVLSEPDVLETEEEAEPEVPVASRKALSKPPPAYVDPSEADPAPARDSPPAAEPAASDVSWTSQSPPPGVHTARPRERSSSGGSRWPYALLGIVLLGAIIWFAVTLGRDAPGAREPQAGTVADTAAVALSPARTEAPRRVVLGDTMHVVVASADSQLVQDIKITVDDDLRRPYWLEAGESRAFAPTQQIVIERELDKIDLLIEGTSFPTDRTDEQGRLVITREVAQDFLSGSQ